MSAVMSQKEATRIVKSRNQLKAKIVKAEKEVWGGKLANFSKNQEKLKLLQKELADIQPQFVVAFKLFVEI